MELRAKVYECADCGCGFAVNIDDLLNEYPRVVDVSCPKCTGSDVAEAGEGEITFAQH